MKSIRTLVLGVVVVMTCFAGSFSLQAADEPGPLEKLGRGIANVALSPLEMIKRPVMIAHQKARLPVFSTARWMALNGFSYVSESG